MNVDAVVIGAGALGAATAFHLAKAGLSVALLDKAELASQRSPRAAGLSGQLVPTETMTRIAARGVEKIATFQAETGEPMVFFQPGSLKIARRPEHEAQLHDEVKRGRELGLDVAMISLDEARRLMPYLVTDGVRAVMHMRTDIYLEPVQVPIGYARASARLGATLLRQYAGRGNPHRGRRRRRRAHTARRDPGAHRGRCGRRLAARVVAAQGGSTVKARADPASADGDGAVAGGAAEPADHAHHRRQCLRAPGEGRADARRLRGRSGAVRHARSAGRF